MAACDEIHEAAKRATAEFNQRSGGPKPVVYVTGCQYLRLLQHIRCGERGTQFQSGEWDMEEEEVTTVACALKISSVPI